MNNFSHIIKQCFINVPFNRLQRDINLILKHKIQPEIGLEGDILYNYSHQDFVNMANILQQAGLPCTFHAPFFDLSPGALDKHIRTATRNKLKKAFNLIPIFKPRSIVCHLHYEENKQGYYKEEWFKHSLATWQELLSIAEQHNTIIMLENTYETTPEQHIAMLTSLNSQHARFCLDVGHTLAFAKNQWQDWLFPLKPWLGQLHLHDNHGDRDNHLAIGQGIFDFAGLFTYLKTKHLKPIITLEPHTEKDLWLSLASLDKMNVISNLYDE